LRRNVRPHVAVGQRLTVCATIRSYDRVPLETGRRAGRSAQSRRPGRRGTLAPEVAEDQPRPIDTG